MMKPHSIFPLWLAHSCWWVKRQTFYLYASFIWHQRSVPQPFLLFCILHSQKIIVCCATNNGCCLWKTQTLISQADMPQNLLIYWTWLVRKSNCPGKAGNDVDSVGGNTEVTAEPFYYPCPMITGMCRGNIRPASLGSKQTPPSKPPWLAGQLMGPDWGKSASVKRKQQVLP